VTPSNSFSDPQGFSISWRGPEPTHPAQSFRGSIDGGRCAAVLRRPPLALRDSLLELRDFGHVLVEQPLPVEREVNPEAGVIIDCGVVAVLVYRLAVGGAVLVGPAGRHVAGSVGD
jgi:hypothetical protein